MSDDLLSASPLDLVQRREDLNTVLAWYDLTCPFCYIGQARTQLLRNHGLVVIDLPYQAHPEVPNGGVYLGARSGPMYASIEQVARAEGLPLHWPARLPNSRIALAAAEWTRRQRPHYFDAIQARLFRAHFADGLDIGDMTVVTDCCAEILGDASLLREALNDPETLEWVSESEQIARLLGVSGTPTWRISGRMIVGVQPEEEFESLLPRGHGGVSKTLM